MNLKKSISAAAALILAAGMTTGAFDGTAMEVSANTNSRSFLYGDVNDDGVINVTDIVKIAAYIEKKITLDARALRAADVNGDDKINQDDINIISNHVKGKKVIDNEKLLNLEKSKEDKNDLKKETPYGIITFEGEDYPIAEPGLITDRRRKSLEIIGESSAEFNVITEVYKEIPFHKIKFSTLDYIAGYELEITNDMHDASNPIGGSFTWVKNKGYLKSQDTFRNDVFHDNGAVFLVAFNNIIDMINGCFTREEVTFIFHKTSSGTPHDVGIVASSSDVEQMYNQYASPYPHYLSSEQGDTRLMSVVDKNCKELYEYFTNNKADDNYFYDLEVSCDERHKNNGRFANLWINADGEVMATPILFDKDYVKIVRKKGSVYNLFSDYETVYNIPLSDTINLGQSFEDLYNNIKKYK